MTTYRKHEKYVGRMIRGMGEYYRCIELCFPEQLRWKGDRERHRPSLMADTGLLEQRLGQDTVLSEEEYKAAACSIASPGSLPLDVWVHEFYLSPLAVVTSMLFPSLTTLGLFLLGELSSFCSLWEDLVRGEPGAAPRQAPDLLGQEVAAEHRQVTHFTDPQAQVSLCCPCYRL